MASTDSPARRVLGDKTTNAPIRTHTPSKRTKTSILPSERLNASSFNAQTLRPSYDVLKSPRAGQKRRIEEVEDAERMDSMEDSQRSDSTLPLSLLSDSASEAGNVSLDATDRTRSTNATSALSFGASQQESAPMETTFEIHEETMSQNSRDLLNAIALPQNASQPLAAQPALLKELSQVSVGMSSFLNFDQIVTSQGDDLKPIKQDEPEAKHSSVHITPRSETNRKEAMDAQAERLRTRLQLAFFKVQTNQASVPFSRLRPHSAPKSPQPPADPFSSSPPSSPPSSHRPSPETRIAIMRARATMQNKPAVQSLGGLPTPKIAPTAFSTRMMSDATLDFLDVPSSPPQTHKSASRDPSADTADADPTPKARPAQLPPHTPMQLSSPPGSPDRSKKLQTVEKLKRQERSQRYNGLTSSVVKGDAANSLLELMKGKQEDD